MLARLQAVLVRALRAAFADLERRSSRKAFAAMRVKPLG
jgi:hypothetical protein